MTLNEFVGTLGSKSVGRKPAKGDDNMAQRVHTALKKIAMKTTPLSLVIEDPMGHRILRRIDDATWIREPHIPSSTNGHEIDIDIELVDAAQYYVMAGLEPQRGKTYMGLFYGELDDYNQRLIESHLATATNDSVKFHQFP